MPKTSDSLGAAPCILSAFVSPVVCIQGRKGVEAMPPADLHASSVSSVLTELCGEAVRSEPAVIYTVLESARLPFQTHFRSW